MKKQAAILAALALSVQATEPEHLLYDVQMEPQLLAVFAASDNILFQITAPPAQTAASFPVGVREFYVAPLDATGAAPAASFRLLGRLRAGDTGPTPEATTEDITYDNGTVLSTQTGTNNGSKTWDIDGSADDPAIALLIDHSRIYGTPEKRGQLFAYIAFNGDRSSLSGVAKVNTATAPREGGQRWSFNVVFQTVELRKPSQNPLAVGTVPAAADITPKSGVIGATVTITGVNMNSVTDVRLGSQVITGTGLTGRTASALSFAVPVGATAGQKVVDLVHAGGEVFAGYFTVT